MMVDKSNDGIKCLDDSIKMRDGTQQCVIPVYTSETQQCGVFSRNISITNKVANSTVYMIGKINRYDCEKYG